MIQCLTFDRVLRNLVPWATLVFAITTGADDKIIANPDFAELERENDLWRAINPESDLETNLARIERKPASAETLRRVIDGVTLIWAFAPDRDLDGLSLEAAEAVREIDLLYLKHFRAARLSEVAGVGGAERSSQSILRGWSRALLQSLAHDELIEFRRCNNPSAEGVRRSIAGLPVPYLERRHLYAVQRTFDANHGRGRQSSRGINERWNDPAGAHEDLRREYRSTLGDQRYLVYLVRTDARFAAMHSAFTVPVDPTAMLNAWELRTRHQRSLRGNETERERAAATVRDSLRDLVGTGAFEAYAQSDDARWMFPRATVAMRRP